MGSQHHVTGGERPDVNLTSIYKRDDDQKSTSCRAKIPGNFWRMNCFRRVTSTFPGMVWSRMRQEALMWNVSEEGGRVFPLPDEGDTGPDESEDVHHWHYRVDVIAVLRHNHLQMWICITVALVEEKRCWLLGFEKGAIKPWSGWHCILWRWKEPREGPCQCLPPVEKVLDTREMGFLDSPGFRGYLLLQPEPDDGCSPQLRNRPSPKRPPLTKANYGIVDRNASFVYNVFSYCLGPHGV